MNRKYKKLIKCLLLDAIGMVSYAVPVVDVVWVPIAAMISYRMFGGKRGRYTALITFAEEILPVTDFIPSFTIFWILFDFIGIGARNDLSKSEAISVVELEPSNN